SVGEILLPAAGLAERLRIHQQPLGLAERFLGMHALGHVLVDHDRTGDDAIRAADGCRVILDGLAIAVEGIDIDQFVAAGLSFFPRAPRRPPVRADLLTRAVPEALAPGPPLFPRENHSAPDAAGGGIVQHDVSRSIEHGHANRESLENLLQQSLAGPDALL